MRAVLAALMLALAAAPAAAQGTTQGTAPGTAPDTAGVRRAVLDYVEGFYEGDSTKLARTLRRDFFKYGYARDRETNAYTGMQMTWDGAMGYARRVKAAARPVPATAPKEITIYEVLDQTATAKLRAWWGIDYMLLAKQDGRWVITHVLWQSPPPAATAGR